MERRRRALSMLKMGVIGIGLIASAFYVGKHNTTLTAFVALFLLLGGVAMLALLCLGLIGRIVVSTHTRRKEAQDRVRTTYVVVEIEATRITAAHSIDDDANAIILHDGLGHGVYINSHQLFDLDVPDGSYPSVWRLTLFSREGDILSWEPSGPLLTIEYDNTPDPETEFDWVEAVVLDERTPEKWQRLAPSVNPPLYSPPPLEAE